MITDKLELLYEGKAKRIYKTNEPNILLVSYKDSATAFNGVKKEEITGKGRLNNEISTLIFEKLTANNIENHFVKRLSETEQLVKKVTIIPLEVVVRNVVAGSLSKRLGIEEGTEIKETLVEFYYKDDELGDPLITEDHIALLNLATKEQVETLKTLAKQVNEVLKAHFLSCDVRLIDFKLEFGVTEEGNIILADEVSPDTCRLWDIKTNEKFDKDVFRRGIGSLTDAYEEILTRLGGQS
ncbi:MULTISPECIES: phosphoribosylaminoimidazolesuccinocarboxamide synthase [Metabacillus]|uniref:Phosphoribosylaminoimidazole-succinocarboxamide synthase n=2 Tax=Metabacillus TaxID=2675233 RepID=A0A179SZG0_9BACI|nr:MULTISPECIES: phosphoribosylaminoimidazolesuccinocarboxamide synthase [Metabacillus]OAS85653.1 phosphoribosylaminoimidazolesuccinocarboxamide synthase [Metabacillus litoralis]QNF27950.1 phosphoribosylaminoimidazolesuccinocarboxamide synthase [Metabacillus sp. KUDC1714]